MVNAWLRPAFLASNQVTAIRISETTSNTPAKAMKTEAIQLLGFVGLAWVVLNQFGIGDHLGLHAAARSGFLDKGYLGAELFFIATGFVISGVWAAQGEQLGYGAFLWRRLAKMYPLHIVAMGVMALLFFAARVAHADFQAHVFDVAAVPANLLLIQGWGVLPPVVGTFRPG